VKHTNELCRFVFNQFEPGEVFPYVVEYRLSTLIRHVFWHEMYALIVPEDIKLDMATVLTTRNFMMFGCYFLPCGFINKSMDTLKDSHIGLGPFYEK